MKNIYFLLLTLLFCQFTHAQNEPYFGGFGRGDVHVTQANILLGGSIFYGGVGRGDVHVTQTNILLGDPLIYFGGVGRGDVHLTQANILLGDPLIYFGGVGRGDVHVTQTNTLLGDALIYYGGVGRGDVHVTQTNTLLGDALIYYGGIGRGDVHVTQTNILLGEALIYTGGFGRGDIMHASTSQLNKEQVWIGPTVAGNNLFSNGANWALGYAPKIGNIKVDNAAVRDMQLVANVEFDTLQFQNNTSIKAELGDFNFKLKHFSASTDRQLFKTNGLGSVVIALFNNGKSLKFNVGNEDYNPVTITNYNTTNDSIAVRVGDDVLSEAYSGTRVGTPNVLRTWFIKKNNANTLGVDFTYEWDTTFHSAPMPGYYLNHFNGVDWEIADFNNYGDPVYNGSRVSIALIGYKGGFSPFTFGDSPISPLPVELLNFNAILNNRIVDITWQTASEQNNDYFTIERSADGFNFEPILYKEGAGNSTSLLSYSDKDIQPLEGVSYYRLKQTDFDGAFEYSDIRVVSASADAQVLIYPNPSSGNVNIRSNQILKNVQLLTADGRIVFAEKELMELNLNLASGVYHLQYDFNESTFSKKIVIVP